MLCACRLLIVTSLIWWCFVAVWKGWIPTYVLTTVTVNFGDPCIKRSFHGNQREEGKQPGFANNCTIKSQFRYIFFWQKAFLAMMLSVPYSVIVMEVVICHPTTSEGEKTRKAKKTFYYRHVQSLQWITNNDWVSMRQSCAALFQ